MHSMNRRLILTAMLLAAAGAGTASADVIELKTGQKIEGEVLKDQADELIVDIGVDIVRIPASQVKSRTGKVVTTSPAATINEANYHTADLPVRSVKELAEQYGEGVVLVQTSSGLGSGFIINEQGDCVTNYHVVEKETRIATTIFTRNEKGEFVRRRIDDVEILALNPYFDLALLKIPAQKDIKFKHVYIAKDDNLKEGDGVFAIGNPLGLERSVSQGIVSTRNRNFEGLTYIQTTTQINPGNSGGPLFNLKGEVVGVTNMKSTFGEGLGFAIPAAHLKLFLKDRDAFAFDKSNPNAGHRYLEAPRRRNPEPIPSMLLDP